MKKIVSLFILCFSICGIFTSCTTNPSNEVKFTNWVDGSNPIAQLKEYVEEVTNENIALKKEINEFKNSELSKQAYSIAIEQGFTEEESKTFEQDCLDGKYTSEAEITKEIIYQAFLKKQEVKDIPEQKDFSAKISDNVKPEKNKDVSSISNLRNFVNN